MHAWLITVGEPLPLAGQSSRLHRTGRLADALLRHGHRVTWWTSTFDHFAKNPLGVDAGPLSVSPGLTLHLLHGTPYRRNVSIRRLVNHWQMGRAFQRWAPRLARPDVILSSFPTIELCVEAVRYGQHARVPVLIDVRDLWPDIFWSALPGVPAWLMKAATYPLARAAVRALRGCDGIVATSEGYLRWALARAHREPGAWDQVIPLGYERPAPPSAVGEVARRPRLRGVNPKRRIAWFIGTFGRSYDLAAVVAAAQHFDTTGRHDVQFVLSGAGEREQEWRALASGLPNVVFTGWLDRAEIAYMMATASIGVAAYATGAPQGLPNKLFEYMAAGLPVVSSLQGEARALLEDRDCGLTYSGGDVAGLVAALERLFNDSALHHRLSENARRAFEQHYSADLVDARLAAHLAAAAGIARDENARLTQPAHRPD